MLHIFLSNKWINFSFGKKNYIASNFFLINSFYRTLWLITKCAFSGDTYFFTQLFWPPPTPPTAFVSLPFSFYFCCWTLVFSCFHFFPPPFLYLFFRAYPSMLDFTTTIQGHLIDTGSRYNNSAHCFLRIVKS